MTVTTVTCDICGKVKGETNHWYEVVDYSGSIQVQPHGSGVRMGDSEFLDLCGESCVLKAVSRALPEFGAVKREALRRDVVIDRIAVDDNTPF